MTTTETWIPTDTFAARLTLVRKELGLNGKDFAERVGYDAGTLNNWEWGRMPRDLAGVVNAISEATGVDRAWLMWGEAASSIRQGDPSRWVESPAAVIDLTMPWPHHVQHLEPDTSTVLPFKAPIPIHADQQTFQLTA